MKREKGITLVILSVTIIVMMIIAGITLSHLNGEYKVVLNAQGKENKEFNNQLKNTQENINGLDTTWKNVTQKKQVDKELVFDETTKEISR